MAFFKMNGHAINLLIVLAANRRAERSRAVGQWVSEEGRSALYRYDPKETGVPLDAAFDADLDDGAVAYIRELLAEALMQVDLIPTTMDFTNEPLGGILEAMERRHAMDVRALAEAFEVTYLDSQAAAAPVARQG